MNKILIVNGNVVLFEEQQDYTLKTVIKNLDILIIDNKIVIIRKGKKNYYLGMIK